MPRRLRIHLPGAFYHVTLRGNHQQAIFFADADRALLNTIVGRALESFATRLHAYCWMSNHLHLLLQAGETAIAAPMRQIASEFARAMQRKISTTGHFFERRYHATLVDTDSYLLDVLRYIHRNPLEAGIVSDLGAYPWSSHRAYLGQKCEAWVCTNFLLGMFAANRASAVSAYGRFVDCAVEPDWVRKLENREVDVLGSDQFVARVNRAQVRGTPRVSLQDLLAEACRRFEIPQERLSSPIRDSYLAKVRAWIGHQARLRHIATLSEVARVLGRTEATLQTGNPHLFERD